LHLDGLGVAGVATTGSGVLGRAQGGIGVQGVTAGRNPSTGMGGAAVVGISEDNQGLAGFFQGSVLVDGSLSVTFPGTSITCETLFASSIEGDNKIFRIDHPLDPANKYLVHTAVESPDMKNVYDGLVTLDGQGEATVNFPSGSGP
jgi:hypothetical protein